jgi:hypothetical protein
MMKKGRWGDDIFHLNSKKNSPIHGNIHQFIIPYTLKENKVALLLLLFEV